MYKHSSLPSIGQLPLQAQAAMGQTAAAAAAVAAVVATEARWDHSAASHDTQGFTPSELAEEITAGRLQVLQDVFPVSEAGVPRSAGDVVQGWRAALDYAHQLATGELLQSGLDHCRAICSSLIPHPPLARLPAELVTARRRR